MDWRNLPSLTSLRAFSALSARLSYSKAANDLSVSHAAVIQQVKALEEHLGLSLVRREGRAIALTLEGEILARDLERGFEAIQRGIEVLTESASSRPVQVTMSPAFATEWLMPRLPDFQKQHPEVTLMLNPTGEVMQLKPGGVDMAIRYRSKDRVEGSVDPVLISDMVVLGTAKLLKDVKPNRPRDLLGQAWLQELGTQEVAEWMVRRGVHLDRPLIINHMPGNLIMVAVRHGEGITFTARGFFQREIAKGEMIVLHSEPASGIYYIETAPGIMRPAVKTFRKWLLQQSEQAVEGSEWVP